MERKALVLWLMSRQRKEDSKSRDMTDEEYRNELMVEYDDMVIENEVIAEAMEKYPKLFPDEEDESLVSIVDYYSMRENQFEKYVRKLLGAGKKQAGGGHDGPFNIGEEEWALEVKTAQIDKGDVAKFIGDMTTSGHTRGLMVTRYLGLATTPAKTEVEFTNMAEQLYIEIRHISDLIKRRGAKMEE